MVHEKTTSEETEVLNCNHLSVSACKKEKVVTIFQAFPSSGEVYITAEQCEIVAESLLRAKKILESL
ncbi:MAG: hypothetical protein RBS34_12855 [Desulfofustis sp.]|jgi:hypothetical protein|nr:hypothetical protein [Desulfofustis sp.]